MAQLIDILKDAATDLSLTRPVSVADTGDPTAVDLLYYANRALRECLKWHDWSALSREGTITGDGAATAFTPPDGFDRMAARQQVQRFGDTAYRLFGPLTADERVDWRARNMLTITPVFWFRGGQIVVQSALGLGQQAFYEYQTKLAVRPSSGADKAAFSNNADACLIDDDMIMLGVAWMFRRGKGQDYMQEFENWRGHMQLLAGRDQSMRPVAAGQPSDFGLPDPVIPETISVT